MQIAQFDTASGLVGVLHVRSLSKQLWNLQIVALDRYPCLHHPAAERPGRHVMMTRRDLLTASAASVALSAASVARPGIAHSRLKTAHILTGFTPGLPDAVARLITSQM